MKPLILDCSLTMAWCFHDEHSEQADAVLEHLRNADAIVPSIWPLEVVNVLLVGERRKRLTHAESARFLALLRALPIAIDHEMTHHQTDGVLALAREQHLSAYDACYLELALRHGAQLATLDDRLAAAATALGIKLFGA